MADLVTGGRDKIPHRPTLLLPNRADIRVLHALEQDLGGSEHISWLADRVQRPGEDVLHYLGRIKARGIFCELEQIEADSLRDMLRREMELGRYVVLLPGHPLQAPGALSDVPGSLLRRLCSLGLPVLPVHAGMISARDDGAVTVSSGDYDVLELRYGEPISPMKPVSALVLAAWMEAQAELYATQQRFDCTLGESIIRSLYARPEMLVIDGVNDTKLDGATLLPLAIALAERLHKQVSQGRVGIILPPGKLCTIAFVACVISGIVPVFINYEATAEEFIHSARRSELTRFITERRFQNKLSDFCWPRERDLIYAESELREVPRGRMAWMRWLPRLQTPESLYRRICPAPPRPEDEAVVIFTGGTDEKPKGISLTHRMLMTGLAEFRSRVQIKRGDRILATMPYGHPLSLMAGLLLPLLGPCDLVLCGVVPFVQQLAYAHCGVRPRFELRAALVPGLLAQSDADAVLGIPHGVFQAVYGKAVTASVDRRQEGSYFINRAPLLKLRDHAHTQLVRVAAETEHVVHDLLRKRESGGRLRVLRFVKEIQL